MPKKRQILNQHITGAGNSWDVDLKLTDGERNTTDITVSNIHGDVTNPKVMKLAVSFWAVENLPQEKVGVIHIHI